MIKTLYPVFQKWSKTGSVYIIGDTHLYDTDRVYMKYLISEEEQINRLKSICHKPDTLICLGDVGDPKLFAKIKSYKVLVMGNHDEAASRFEPYFDEIYTGPIWIAEKLVLSHEPLSLKKLVLSHESLCLESGVTKNPIAFNIHGHDHSGEYYNDEYHLNLAQNVYGYDPLSLSDFIKSGCLKHVKSIHRETIDTATMRKQSKK